VRLLGVVGENTNNGGDGGANFRQTAPRRGALWVEMIVFFFYRSSGTDCANDLPSTADTYGIQGNSSNVFYPQNVPP